MAASASTPLKQEFKTRKISVIATSRNTYTQAHLTAAPGNSLLPASFKTGVQPLGLDSGKDGLLYVPQTYTHDKPAALAVMLHGAGGVAEHGLHLLRPYADEHYIILLAPASRLGTWDIIATNEFNHDVIFIDEALSLVFSRYAIDKAHIAIGGFSDGASYALCLGLSNGNLFTHLISFSPGFYYTRKPSGSPSIFISHGIHDHVLPINPCSRRIVPELKRQGYQVDYREFEGEHEIPPSISLNAVEGFKL